MYVHIYIYNDHCCGVETNHDVTCRDNGTRFAPEREESIERKGDATPRCRRLLPFPLTCQYRRNITKDRSLWIEEATRVHDADDHYLFRGHTNKNTEVYGSWRRGSTYRRPLLFPLTCQNRRNITKDRSLWIEEATRLHDADNHYHFRRHTSKNATVYGSG